MISKYNSNGKQILTPAQWRWVAERYLEGYEMRALADFLRVHPHTVSKHIQQLGIPVPDRSNKLRDLKELRGDFLKVDCMDFEHDDLRFKWYWEDVNGNM